MYNQSLLPSACPWIPNYSGKPMAEFSQHFVGVCRCRLLFQSCWPPHSAVSVAKAIYCEAIHHGITWVCEEYVECCRGKRARNRKAGWEQYQWRGEWDRTASIMRGNEGVWLSSLFHILFNIANTEKHHNWTLAYAEWIDILDTLYECSGGVNLFGNLMHP